MNGSEHFRKYFLEIFTICGHDCKLHTFGHAPKYEIVNGISNTDISYLHLS